MALLVKHLTYLLRQRAIAIKQVVARAWE